jgi:chloramphenicol O-acetyltransferase type A
MIFHPIDMDTWSRKPYFDHYLHNVRCTFSMTANIDITRLLPELKSNGFKLFPALIHMLTTVVNRHTELRMGYDSDGYVGYWESMFPSYTIFHEDDKTFSSIWTAHHEDFHVFNERYLADLAAFGEIKQFTPKSNEPPYTFPISCVPWVSFTGFNLNIYNEGTYLSPIFTIGKYFRQADSILLPLAVQMHHAVCDGYHASLLVQEMQALADAVATWLPRSK